MSTTADLHSTLTLLHSTQDAFDAMADFVLAHPGRDDGRPLAILEAGCGRSWPLDLGGIDYTLTGVDMNERSLQLRKEQQGDLDVAVCGDLRTVDLPEGSFDVIYCSYVLEHIDGAREVLDSFVRWLRPQGRIVLAVPDRDSVFGFVTRMSPHRVHVAYRRHLLGERTAGTPGYGPFRTYYDPVVSRRGIHEYCDENDLVVRAEYGSSPFLPRLGKLRRPVERGSQVLSKASGGRLAADHSNLLFFIEKPAAG